MFPLFQQAAENILGVENAHDIVAGVLVNGNARMTGTHNDARHFLKRHVIGNAVHIGAGDHGVLHLKIVEAQDAKEHGFLVGFHLAVGSCFQNGFFERFLIVVPEQSAQARPDGTVTFRAAVQNNLLGWRTHYAPRAFACGATATAEFSCLERMISKSDPGSTLFKDSLP